MEKVLLLLIACAYFGVYSKEKRCGTNEEYHQCGSCQETCGNPLPNCNVPCKPACACRNGSLRNYKGRCVFYDHCFAPIMPLVPLSIPRISNKELIDTYRCTAKDDKTLTCLRQCHEGDTQEFMKKVLCSTKCCGKKTRAGSLIEDAKDACI